MKWHGKKTEINENYTAEIRKSLSVKENINLDQIKGLHPAGP